MGFAEDHLGLQEIEWLAGSRQTALSAFGTQERVEQARHHLASCQPCRELVRAYEVLQEKFDKRADAGELSLRPDCPPTTKWWSMVAGLLPEPEVSGLLEHSIHCDACGLLLRQATQDFADETTEKDSALLASLASSQSEWGQALAQKLSTAPPGRSKSPSVVPIPPTPKPRRLFRFAWAYAAAAMIFLAAGAWLVQTRRALRPSGPSIDELIASAYAEQRPFEMRIAGAAYGPLRQERGQERSAFGEPAALLRAKYLIKDQLSAHPDDPVLLAASARVELLEGHSDEAIRTLGRLVDTQPDSPELLTDLATAYFQRAEAGDRAIDYGQTVELLSRALAKRPDDPVALFNRAVALEKLYSYGEAVRDWEHYLRVDPSGGWAAEARRRLNDLREKMKNREKPLAMLQANPVAATPLLRARATGQSTPLPWPASLDEEYLDIAVREWLPSLYASVVSPGRHSWQRNAPVWDALVATSDVLIKHHRDRWLADLLGDVPADSPKALERFIAALGSLSRAAKANASGDPDSARPLAESAARSFRAVNSPAGLLRAREEFIYSLVRGARAQDCIRAARQQLREGNLDSYAWLKGQAILWHATCQSFAGNLDLAQRLSERALELTKSTAYAGQHLRGVLFASGFLRSTERNWQDTRAGLQQFWADWHNPFHASESYVELATLAEEVQKSHLAQLMRREALAMIERTPDNSLRAVDRYYLAVAARMAGDLSEAESEFKVASYEFAGLSISPVGQSYKAASEIHLAAVEVLQGRLDSADAHLNQAEPQLAHTSDIRTTLAYHQARGQLHLRRGNRREAEQALWRALRMGEVQLRSLQTDADRLGWEREASSAYRTLVELYVPKQGVDSRALELWEWYLASALRRSTPPHFVKDFEFANPETGPTLPLLVRMTDIIPTLKNQTILSFARLPSGLAAWVFDDRGVNFAWISASEEDLARRVKHLDYLCADPSSDLTKLQQEGRNLYDWLLAPFERHLDSGRLLVVESDSFLSDVPWSALVDSRGEYLGSRFAIVVSPGLGYWLRLRPSGAVSAEQEALVVGAPALAPSIAARFSPLPDADREARSIAARFQHSRLLLGMAVTSLAIRRELSRSDVFHFAGHAVSGFKQSGLVLASLPPPDGSGEELTLLSGTHLEESLLRRVQLVVLSACATAEPDRGFTEPGTLVRGFLRSGIPHVLASRWPVDSQTTAETMAEFYSHLFEGLPPAQALRRATDKLRLQPATSHPYYWAAFCAYGR